MLQNSPELLNHFRWRKLTSLYRNSAYQVIHVIIIRYGRNPRNNNNSSSSSRVPYRFNKVNKPLAKYIDAYSSHRVYFHVQVNQRPELLFGGGWLRCGRRGNYGVVGTPRPADWRNDVMSRPSVRYFAYYKTTPSPTAVALVQSGLSLSVSLWLVLYLLRYIILSLFHSRSCLPLYFLYLLEYPSSSSLL